MDNFCETKGYDVRGFSKLMTSMDKGHKNLFHRFIKAVQRVGDALIPFDSLINTTRASFAAIESLKENSWADIK